MGPSDIIDHQVSDFRQQQVDQLRILMVEEKQIGVEKKLQTAIDTGERKANVTRYTNQLAKLPPVDQDIRERLLKELMGNGP